MAPAVVSTPVRTTALAGRRLSSHWWPQPGQSLRTVRTEPPGWAVMAYAFFAPSPMIVWERALRVGFGLDLWGRLGGMSVAGPWQ